jgi:hypothetical protein
MTSLHPRTSLPDRRFMLFGLDLLLSGLLRFA